jgi:hypothetical protein
MTDCFSFKNGRGENVPKKKEAPSCWTSMGALKGGDVTLPPSTKKKGSFQMDDASSPLHEILRVYILIQA